MENQEAFKNAVAAAKKKDFVTAQQILRGILQKDSKNIDALLLFSIVADKKEYSVQALKRILQIDPEHKIARNKLAQLEKQESTAKKKTVAQRPVQKTPLVETTLKEVEEKPQLSIEERARQELLRERGKIPVQRKEKKKFSPTEIILGVVLVFACICVGILGLGTMVQDSGYTSVPTPTNDEVFAVLHENINAMNAKSISRYMATVHPDSSVYDATEEALQESFRLFDLQSHIGYLEVVEQTRSEVQVSFVLTTRKIRGPAFKDNQVTGVMTLRRDGDKWKIYRQRTDDVTYLD